MKYVLFNNETKKYFVKYEPTNKPVWCDKPDDAAAYDVELAMQMRKRLYCQSQIVILLRAKELQSV